MVHVWSLAKNEINCWKGVVFLDTQAVDEVMTDKVTLVLTEAVCLVVGAFSPTGIPESVWYMNK